MTPSPAHQADPEVATALEVLNSNLRGWYAAPADIPSDALSRVVSWVAVAVAGEGQWHPHTRHGVNSGEIRRRQNDAHVMRSARTTGYRYEQTHGELDSTSAVNRSAWGDALLRCLDGWLKGPIEDPGEPRNLFCKRFSRGRPCFSEPGNDDLVVGE